MTDIARLAKQITVFACLAAVCSALVATAGRAGRRQLSAAPDVEEPGSSTSGVACSNSAGSISPCTSGTSVYAGTTGNLFIFTVSNTSGTLREGGISCGKSGSISACTVLTNTYSLNGHTSMTDTVSYTAGAAGSGTVTASTSGQLGTLTATLTVTVNTPPYADSVTPKGYTQPAVGLATNTVYFTVKNWGANSATFNLSPICVSTASACTLVTASSVTLASGASTFPTVTYTAGAVGTAGTVKLAATYASNSAITDTGAFRDTSVVSVAATPDNTVDTLTASTASSYTFHLSNLMRPVSTTYTLTATCTAPATGCSAPASVTMDANAGDSAVTVAFTSGGTGATGKVRLLAVQSTDAANKDSGWVSVTSAAATLCNNGTFASITPCATSPSVSTNTAASQSYTLTNASAFQDSYNYSCSVSGQVAPGSCTVTGPGSLTGHGTGSVVVKYTTSGKTGAGGVVLTVGNSGTPLTVPITVTVVGPAAPLTIHRVLLSPHYQTLEEDPSQVDTVLFAIKNAGTDTAWFRATRGCTTHGVASCVTATDSVRVKPDSTGSLRLIFTMSGTAGFRDTATFVVRQSGDTTARDSAMVELSDSSRSAGVSVAGLNPGTTLDRNLCLTIAAGAGAAIECGDLRLVHVFPGVRTYNKARTPTLLYNSAHAHPFVTIRADYTIPGTGGIPDSVTAVLRDSAGNPLANGKWLGSQWTAGATRRIALTFDAQGLPTGIHRYRFVTARFTAGVPTRDSVFDAFMVINRMTSPFGPGWWLAGYEQLLHAGADTMLWVGGDGSARRYTRAGANSWGAANVDRPDSILFRSGNYERLLKHGLIVRFNSSGQHIATVNRLGQTTTFHAQTGSGLLDTITVAPTSGGLRFTFVYDVNGSQPRLRLVRAPSVNGQARYDSLRVNGSNEVTTFRRIDGSTVSFGYDAGVSHRITSRTNELAYTTSYGYGTGSVVTQVTAPIDGSTNAVTTLTPWETRGVAGSSALPLDVAYAKLDGPRTDVGDSSLFWLDKYGQPRRIRNALGDETALSRASATWPALVTRLRAPTGQILGAVYDVHGNDSISTDSATFDPARGKYATTRYFWDLKWDFPTKIISPESDSAVFSYDTTYGNKRWQQDGNGNRVTFTYETTAGVTLALPRTDSLPTGEVDSIFYEAVLGNLARTRTPLGFTQNFQMDSIGRVIRDSTPTDSAMWHVRAMTFDLLDQVTMTRDSAGGSFLQAIMQYDLAGNLDTLKKLSRPDKNSIDTVKQVFAYDRANRKTSEATVGFASWTFAYDLGGNLTMGGRMPTTNTYDALNRVVKKVADDTATFVYDAGGRLVAANNSSARIARSYNVNGTLRADTARLATDSIKDQDFTQFVYALNYRYDLNGRLLARGDNLGSASADTVQYGYDPGAGMLTLVTDLFGHQFRFHYDADQRIDSVTRFADRADSAIGERRRYDADGRLVARVQKGKNFTIQTDTLTYNVQNKVAHNLISGDSAHYNPLGQLTYGAYQPGGHERFDYDADGNQDTSIVVGEASQRTSWFSYDQHSNQLNHIVHPVNGPYRDTTSSSYAQGRVTVSQDLHPYDLAVSCSQFITCNLHFGERRRTTSNFGTDGRLRRTYFTLDSIPNPNFQYQRYTYTEGYRYDALGRRVWKRILRDANCGLHDAASGCVSAVTRTAWDGDQVLYEIRTAAGPNPGITGSQFGTVGYVHAFGIDEPIELFRSGAGDIVLPYLNWRGNYNVGTCPLAPCAGDHPVFPSSEQSSYGEFFPKGVPNWYGDVIVGQIDASGLLYRRNRYLDPKTGRFTQEDPLGLAGGLNAYGFARNDPVNYRDPFGLCPPKDSDPCNMTTGDPNLDEAATRQGMEDAFKSAPEDAKYAGYTDEVSGFCTANSCTTTPGTIYGASEGNRPAGAKLQFHTHGNVGKDDPNNSTQAFSDHPSPKDKKNARSPTRRGLSSYIVSGNSIYRLTPDGKGGTSVTCFQRWNNSTAGCPK